MWQAIVKSPPFLRRALYYVVKFYVLFGRFARNIITPKVPADSNNENFPGPR